jgi:hypothetical protein
MADFVSFPIEEGGVGEQFYLFLNTSDYERHGGRRSNNFSFKKQQLAPPAAGRNIDATLWRIIVKGIRYESDKVGNCILRINQMLTFVVILPFLILTHTLPDDATMADHPAQIVVCWVFIVVLMLAMIVSPYGSRKKNKGYQKVVSALAHRFQEQGFEIEFIVHYDYYIIACPYVRFTPNGKGRQVGQTDDDLGVFNLHDWKPLEGTWEMTEMAYGGNSWLFPLVKSTFEFQIIESLCSTGQDQALQEDDEELNARTGDSLTIDDTHFVSKGNIHVPFLWFNINRSLSFTGKTTGNTHVMKPAQQKSDGDIIITPIETGGNASCYRWGDSCILIVQGSKMLRIDFLYEEIPPVSRLLSDASLFKDGRKWMEFQKTGLGGSGTDSTMPLIV